MRLSRNKAKRPTTLKPSQSRSSKRGASAASHQNKDGLGSLDLPDIVGASDHPLMVKIGGIDTQSMKSRSSRTSRHSEEEDIDEDFNNIGKDILKDVLKGPRQTRMGDIYHEIKNVVDKLSGAYKRRRFKKNF